jgi:hypothetical protein
VKYPLPSYFLKNGISIQEHTDVVQYIIQQNLEMVNSEGTRNLEATDTMIDDNNDELLFHRHCQATVLSAYGIGG